LVFCKLSQSAFHIFKLDGLNIKIRFFSIVYFRSRQELSRTGKYSEEIRKPGKLSGHSLIVSKVELTMSILRFLYLAEEMKLRLGAAAKNGCRNHQGNSRTFRGMLGDHTGSGTFSTFARCLAVAAMKFLVIVGAEIALFKCLYQPLFLH
jgi:hypothetical protein